jgi:Tol biopolymer transport system component
LVVLGIGSEPAWSPDGKSLAFTRTVAGHRHLFVARADGTEDRPITDGPDDDERPTWSPDGRSIAFCTTLVDATAWPQSNLFVVRADGSGLVQLTEGDHVACHPSWGRDGFVYFHANARDRFHIWRLRPRLE